MIPRLPASHPDFRLDFLGIGAGKAGTTWLADVLRLHPDVYIPPLKELIYFNRDIAFTHMEPNYRYGKPLSWYHEFFQEAPQPSLKGELSPTYLCHGNSAADIHAYNPHIRLVAILRDPLKRAYSHHLYFLSKAFIDEPDFERAVEKHPYLLDESMYGEQLERYFDLFPPEQIQVLFFDDLRKDARAFYRSVLAFLGLRDWVPDEVDRPSNETMDVRSPALNRAINRARMFIHQTGMQGAIPMLRKTGIIPAAEYIRDRLNTRPSARKKQGLAPELDARLRARFVPDIEKIERLTGRDLSDWKHPAST